MSAAWVAGFAGDFGDGNKISLVEISSDTGNRAAGNRRGRRSMPPTTGARGARALRSGPPPDGLELRPTGCWRNSQRPGCRPAESADREGRTVFSAQSRPVTYQAGIRRSRT